MNLYQPLGLPEKIRQMYPPGRWERTGWASFEDVMLWWAAEFDGSNGFDPDPFCFLGCRPVGINQYELTAEDEVTGEILSNTRIEYVGH